MPQYKKNRKFITTKRWLLEVVYKLQFHQRPTLVSWPFGRRIHLIGPKLAAVAAFPPTFMDYLTRWFCCANVNEAFPCLSLHLNTICSCNSPMLVDYHTEDVGFQLPQFCDYLSFTFLDTFFLRCLQIEKVLLVAQKMRMGYGTCNGSHAGRLSSPPLTG